MATKAERRRLHAAINNLSREQVSGIVKTAFPKAKGAKLDALAGQIVDQAHRLVSPRKKSSRN